MADPTITLPKPSALTDTPQPVPSANAGPVDPNSDPDDNPNADTNQGGVVNDLGALLAGPDPAKALAAYATLRKAGITGFHYSGPASVLRLEQAIQGPASAAVRDAATYLEETEHATYTGECAHNVRVALEHGAGCDFVGRPTTADGYIDYFKNKLGINPIADSHSGWSPDMANTGDVVIFPGSPAHPAGHMEMCVGKGADGHTIWVSDCEQPHGFLANHNMAGSQFYVYQAQTIIEHMRNPGQTASTVRAPVAHRPGHGM